MWLIQFPLAANVIVLLVFFVAIAGEEKMQL